MKGDSELKGQHFAEMPRNRKLLRAKEEEMRQHLRPPSKQQWRKTADNDFHQTT